MSRSGNLEYSNRHLIQGPEFVPHLNPSLTVSSDADVQLSYKLDHRLIISPPKPGYTQYRRLHTSLHPSFTKLAARPQQPSLNNSLTPRTRCTSLPSSPTFSSSYPSRSAHTSASRSRPRPTPAHSLHPPAPRSRLSPRSSPRRCASTGPSISAM